MWHMLLRAEEDPDHILGATIAKCLDILQSTLAINFTIIAKKEGYIIKVIKCDIKIDTL